MYWKSATLYWRGRETWKNVNFCSLLTLTCPCLPTKIGKSGKSALFLLLSYSVKWLWNFFQLLKEIVYQHSYSWIICLAIKKLKTNVIKKLLKICSFFSFYMRKICRNLGMRPQKMYLFCSSLTTVISIDCKKRC